MRKTSFAIALGMMLAAFPAAALAHVPYLVGEGETVRVLNPETSHAFYGVLTGNAHTYTFSRAKPFTLYLNVLVPGDETLGTDVYARAYRVDPARPGGREFINVIGGVDESWEPMHEIFGNDDYLKGQELRASVTAGDFVVEVTSADTHGRYVLAIGEREWFGPTNIVRTALAMPRVKIFMGASPFTAYFNVFGVILVALVLGCAGIVWAFLHMWRRYR